MMLSIHGWCQSLETTTAWLLQLPEYCNLLDIATSWTVPLAGGYNFLDIATSWILPLPGGVCDTEMLSTSRPCVYTSYELRDDDVLS